MNLHSIDAGEAPTAGSSSLTGDIGRFLAVDVLQFLKLAGATGRLEFERHGERVRMEFAHGRPLWACGCGRTVRLGEVRVRRHGMAPATLALALADQASQPGERLGRLLAARGVTPDAVAEAVAEVFRRLVCMLSLWPDGRFEFTPGAESGSDDAGLEFELERLILEGLHQADLAHDIA